MSGSSPHKTLHFKHWVDEDTAVYATDGFEEDMNTRSPHSVFDELRYAVAGQHAALARELIDNLEEQDRALREEIEVVKLDRDDVLRREARLEEQLEAVREANASLKDEALARFEQWETAQEALRQIADADWPAEYGNEQEVALAALSKPTGHPVYDEQLEALQAAVEIIQQERDGLREALKAVMEVGDRSAVFVAESALDSFPASRQDG